MQAALVDTTFLMSLFYIELTSSEAVPSQGCDFPLNKSDGDINKIITITSRPV